MRFTGSVLFGVASGGVVMGLSGSVQEQMITFAGGQLPSLAVAICCGLFLGLIVGTTFGALGILFSEDMAPLTVSAAVSQAFIPVMAAAVPVYILARLLVGEGPTLAMSAPLL